jgi:DNA gyrase subunit A
MLITDGGQMICIGASDLRVIGRNTQGVRLFNLKDGDKLVSAAVLAPEEIVESPALDEGDAEAGDLSGVSEESTALDESDATD